MKTCISFKYDFFKKKKNSSSIMQSWLYHSFAFPKKEVSNAPGIWKKQMARVVA